MVSYRSYIKPKPYTQTGFLLGFNSNFPRIIPISFEQEYMKSFPGIIRPEKTTDIWRRYHWLAGKPVVASPNHCQLSFFRLPGQWLGQLCVPLGTSMSASAKRVCDAEQITGRQFIVVVLGVQLGAAESKSGQRSGRSEIPHCQSSTLTCSATLPTLTEKLNQSSLSIKIKGFEVYGKESLSNAIYMRFSVRVTENVELMR